MESEILQKLELIRGYVLTIMVVFVIWFFFKILESIQKIFTGFKKAWDTKFENDMENHMDQGKYDKVLEECLEKLEKFPNHLDATWYAAKAHFYKENDEESKKYFEKALYLAPSWKKTINGYLEKIHNR